jgi:predicted Zn-dependent peptidase
MRSAPGRVLFAACVAGVVCAAGALRAGPDVWKEKPQKSALTTGVPVIFHRDKASPMTVVGLFAPGGRAAVPEGLDGLAFLTTRLTLEIPDEGKVRDLMAQATRMTYLCEEDCSFVFIECLSANLEDALRVAGKIIQDPLMTGVRIGRAKDMMELMAKAEEDDAVATGGNAALKAFFQGKGYGSSSYGTEASRKAIERKDVLAFFRRHFTAKNVFFCVTSDLDPAQVRALLEKHFAKFPEGERPEVPSPAPVLPADRDVRSVKDTKQTYIGRAYALPAPAAPADHAKGFLLEVLVGQGPGSRLWDLRTAGRLAYNVDSRVTWTRGGGILEAFLETENAKAVRAAEALDGALRELWEKGVGPGELEATKTMAKAAFLRSAEMKATRTRILGGFEVLGLGFEHISGLFEALDAVTLEELNAHIRSILDPERALRITVGPEGPGPSKG